MNVLSFDPGRMVGMALTRWATPYHQVLLHDSFDGSFAWDGFDKNDIDFVAIEQVGKVYPKANRGGVKGISSRMATNIVEATRIEERLAMEARQRGLEIEFCTAAEWRTAIVGKHNPSTAEIRRALRLRCAVRTLEVPDVHALDAIGAGIFCLERRRLLQMRKR